MAYNGLRVGDVALCCPETSGRQGNIAYTLLQAGVFSVVALLFILYLVSSALAWWLFCKTWFSFGLCSFTNVPPNVWAMLKLVH
jgi:hypothetical protein